MEKVLVISLFLITVWGFVNYKVRTAKFDIDKTNFNQKWVKESVKDYAMECVKKEYISSGKSYTTKTGKLKKVYLDRVFKKTGSLLKLCFRNYYFNDEFKEFIKRYDKNFIKKNNFAKMLQEFETYKENNRKENLARFVKLEAPISVKEFFSIYKSQKGDFVGCYVIYNKNKDLFYVGQSKRVMFRLNQHFTGHGNGDVYADYKYNNEFEIRVAVLSESGYDDLDLLERELIEKYDAFEKGYNRNSGNR